MNDAASIVFDLQRGALHDGPGVRTVVFLKGCPLRCVWCHNPESQSFEPETGRSGRMYGWETTVSATMAVVRRDVRYYAESGGGLTVSGGEPTAQYDFCRALLAAAREEGIHTCLDTCGALDWPHLDALRPLVDVFLYDYKATGSARHSALVGIPPDLPLANLTRLLGAGANVRLRCPLVPGVNDDPEHLGAIAALGRQHPRLAIDLMPYHEVGLAKYDDLGRPRPKLDTHMPSPNETAAWLDALHRAGALQAALG
jgi:pyruvate formate lyase activating enzyme